MTAESPRVILLHGLWMRGLTLRPLAHRLTRAGFETGIFDYASIRGGPEPAVARLIERIATRASESVDLVAHSLGGLVALETLARHPELPVRRVICLGSPLRGSGAACGLAQRGVSDRLLGRSAELLCRGFERWDGEAEVGAIAGTLPLGLGWMVNRFAGAHDGTVGVDETRIPGLADHCVVHASHMGLLLSKAAARQVAHFLRAGRFEA